MVGTVLYMAPEVINSFPYTAESDIWSLGVILYEICTSNRPFGNQAVDQAAIMTQILTTEP
jgi:serine/threonine protein kinase